MAFPKSLIHLIKACLLWHDWTPMSNYCPLELRNGSIKVQIAVQSCIFLLLSSIKQQHYQQELFKQLEVNSKLCSNHQTWGLRLHLVFY